MLLVPDYLWGRGRLTTPPPVMLTPPGPLSAPESEMLRGLAKASAHWKVIFPLRVSSVIGTDDIQVCSAPTVPPDNEMLLVAGMPVPNLMPAPPLEPIYKNPPELVTMAEPPVKVPAPPSWIPPHALITPPV